VVVLYPAIRVTTILDMEVKSKGWGLVGVESVKTDTVGFEDFEPIFDNEQFKEFEELLKFYDTHYSNPKHIRVFTYGKSKDKIIALVLIKDHEHYKIVTYDVNKSIEELKKLVKFIERYEYTPPLTVLSRL
jgi:hypothetical protein